ncbi:MAG: hypothetical protein F6J93_09895 [Oscillatoria sp. SIO1A7]|nr:hypothetical protein [Oscillatoria sp. SIO1A7]
MTRNSHLLYSLLIEGCGVWGVGCRVREMGESGQGGECGGDSEAQNIPPTLPYKYIDKIIYTRTACASRSFQLQFRVINFVLLLTPHPTPHTLHPTP